MVASRAKPSEEPIKPVYVIHGADGYLRRTALAAVTRQVLGDAEEHLAFSPYEGDAAGLAEVLDDLRTPPFLAPVRLVAVKDADAFISRHRGALEAYLESPSRCGALVLICKTFPATTRLAKVATRIGEVNDCTPPKGRDLDRWLLEQSEAIYEKRLDRPAAGLLRELVGDDLGRLDCELAKLGTYVGDRAVISVADVQALVGHHREEKVFGIIDAIADRDSARALQLWQQVWSNDRAAPGRAIGGLAWGVRRLLTARLDVERGVPAGKAAARLGRNPQQARRQMERFSTDELESRLIALLDADLRTKTGLGDVQSVVQQFIVAWCTGESSR